MLEWHRFLKHEHTDPDLLKGEEPLESFCNAAVGIILFPQHGSRIATDVESAPRNVEVPKWKTHPLSARRSPPLLRWHSTQVNNVIINTTVGRHDGVFSVDGGVGGAKERRRRTKNTEKKDKSYLWDWNHMRR